MSTKNHKLNLKLHPVALGVALTCQALAPSANSAVTTPIGTDGLAGYWPLDNHWRDLWRGHDLTPAATGGFSTATYVGGAANMSYGPTGRASGNGAQSAAFTSLNRSRGVTLEGWFLLPSNTTSGRLIGFGQNWVDPKLVVTVGWGFLNVNVGKQGQRVDLGFTNPQNRYGDDTCWHHLAVVVAALKSEGTPIQVYVDGATITPSSITGLPFTAATVRFLKIFGAPFRIGQFESTDGSGNGAA